MDAMNGLLPCYICIADDLNSHSGTDRDYVVIDDFIPEQINYDSEAQRILNDIAWLNNKGINPSRSNTDHRNPDIYGRHLLEFCKSNGLFICNGRLKNDLIGKATTTQGSVIDYMLCSPVIMCKTKNFYIHDFDAFFQINTADYLGHLCLPLLLKPSQTIK